jgi:CheY-like chemotaxis protein
MTSPVTLIIDDDPLLRQVVSAILSSAGHSVHAAANGQQAIRILEAIAVDNVITDIWMPEMEGLETIIHIAKRHPAVRIVAISGGKCNERYDVLKLAESLGADAVLAKPFGKDELLAAIERASKAHALPLGIPS